MSFKLQNQVMDELSYSATYLRTLRAIAGYANSDGENIFVKDETLADKLKVHKDTVGRHRRRFIKDGYLVATGTRGYNNRVTVYKLVLKPAQPEPEETHKTPESVGNFWDVLLAKINDDIKHDTNDDTFAVKHGNCTISNTTLLSFKHDTFVVDYNKESDPSIDPHKDESSHHNINQSSVTNVDDLEQYEDIPYDLDPETIPEPIADDSDSQKTDDEKSVQSDWRWDATKSQLELQMDRSTFDVFLRDLEFVSIAQADDTLELTLSTERDPDAVNNRFNRNIRRLFQSVAGCKQAKVTAIQRAVKDPPKSSAQKVPVAPAFRFVGHEPAETDVSNEVRLYAQIYNHSIMSVQEWVHNSLRNAIKRHGRETVRQGLKQIKDAKALPVSWKYFETTFSKISQPEREMA